MNTLPPESVMRRAVARRDAAFDGIFFFAVRTTGVFCRPSCRSRSPRPENLAFFARPANALAAGFRACKRCRPLEAGTAPPRVVARLLARLEQDPGRRLRDADLAALGIDASTARRQFRAWCGMTFQQYQRARRVGEAMATLREGTKVIDAQLASGYGSPSGFRAAFAKLFGTKPSASASPPLVADWIETPIGPMFAIASADGLCLVDFADRKGLESAVVRLRARFCAAIAPGRNAHIDRLRRQLSEYFAGARTAFDVPLVGQAGTAFQQKAWAYLRTIPFGETRAYADEARALGAPRAVRAVGAANGMNYLALVVPCHRVIGADGRLVGYGGGLARKRWLLAHEARVAAGAAQRRAA